ncbi:MAG: hypothetical protein K6A94_09010 [Bacteroidales bacterium]|nr:hypothetical protein [Bacteroidales bacterium]
MRMRIPGHRTVVLLGITLLMVLGCQTPPGPLLEGERTSLASPAAARHPLMEGEACRTLESIDSLMWRQPDSAFALLQAFAASPEADSLDESDIHYFQLLLSELLYKNDCEQTNRKDLLRAVAYYDSIAGSPGAEARGMSVGPFRRRDASHASAQTTAFLAARAHYINGVGFYESDSVVEACKEYLKALETMEIHFEGKALTADKVRLMALICTHLSMIYSDQYLHEQSIYFGRLCLQYYQKYEAVPWHLAWTLNEIGSNYDMLEELDSADFYYRKAIEMVDDTSMLMYRNIVTHLVYLGYKRDKNKAKEVITSLYHLLSVSGSPEESILRYSCIGEVLYDEKELDSALIVWSKVFQESSNIGLKKQAAERLVKICKAQQINEGVLEYAEFLVPYVNQEENKSEIKSRLTELYKAYSQVRLKRQNQKQIKQALAVVMGMSFLLLIISLLYYLNRRRKRNLETLIESERKAHKIQQEALAGRLRRSNAALKERIDEKRIMDDLFAPHKANQENIEENYEEEPICQQILGLCNDKKNPIKSTVPISAYAGLALNDMQKARLKEAASLHYGFFFEKLKLQYPDLKEKDFLYCYLCLLGLDNTQIAVLLQHSISTIWER